MKKLFAIMLSISFVFGLWGGEEERGKKEQFGLQCREYAPTMSLLLSEIILPNSKKNSEDSELLEKFTEYSEVVRSLKEHGVEDFTVLNNVYKGVQTKKFGAGFFCNEEQDAIFLVNVSQGTSCRLIIVNKYTKEIESKSAIQGFYTLYCKSRRNSSFCDIVKIYPKFLQELNLERTNIIEKKHNF